MAHKIYTADAVILGSGAAGMMAAMVIAQSGYSCVILEKGKNIAASNASRAGGPALAIFWENEIEMELLPDAYGAGFQAGKPDKHWSSLATPQFAP